MIYLTPFWQIRNAHASALFLILCLTVAARAQSDVLNNPPGFKRKFVEGSVKVPDITFSNSAELYLATVLPHQVAQDEQAIIVCKSNTPGQLTIDLYSRDGKKLEKLFTREIDKNRTVVYTWDGKSSETQKRYKGEYLIRWSIGDGYREFPVVLK
jgi:hypothetical protein